jgi:murein L,D-transpeptidase YcbB/YkuD
VESLRNECTGQRPVHSFHRKGAFAAALIAGAAALLTPVAAAAQPIATAASSAALARPQSGQSVEDFYKARKGASLWLSPQAGDAAQQLIAHLSSASVDGLSPAKYNVGELQQLLARAEAKHKRKDIRRADEALSEAFVSYVDDLRQDPGVGITWVDPQLRPTPPSPLAALLQAASAPSLPDYVAGMGWMHPFYGELRDALVEHKYSDDHQREILELNLKRTRVLPAGKERYVLVNAAQQRLFMYENGKPVDSMVVVVGKTKYPTPMLAAYIRYAALNPYWYVPPDLAWDDVGQFVEKQGFGYFEKMGYEQVSSWKDPQVLDATKIDWDAVRDGKTEIYLRQKPGPENFMGRIKFMFPNQFGVYLHDNPRRELFEKSVRYFSGGCVRLEDAWRLSRWLFHRELTWEGHGTEEPVPLDQPVPVYITYMTAVPDGQAIAYYDDAYGRDKAKLAGADDAKGGSTSSAASR